MTAFIAINLSIIAVSLAATIYVIRCPSASYMMPYLLGMGAFSLGWTFIGLSLYYKHDQIVKAFASEILRLDFLIAVGIGVGMLLSATCSLAKKLQK